MTAARRILCRPGELRRILDALRCRYAVCREQCAVLTGKYGVERTDKSGDGGADALAVLADIDREIEQREEELAAAERDTEILLDRLAALPGRCSARDAEILRLRDVRELPWAAVRAELTRSGYDATERTVYNWHSAALRRLEQFL